MPWRFSDRAAWNASSRSSPATNRMATRRPRRLRDARWRNQRRPVSHSTGARSTGPFTGSSGDGSRDPEYRQRADGPERKVRTREDDREMNGPERLPVRHRPKPATPRRPLGPSAPSNTRGRCGTEYGRPFVGLWGLPNLPTRKPRWPPPAYEQVRPVGLTAFPGVSFPFPASAAPAARREAKSTRRPPPDHGCNPPGQRTHPLVEEPEERVTRRTTSLGTSLAQTSTRSAAPRSSRYTARTSAAVASHENRRAWTTAASPMRRARLGWDSSSMSRAA